MHSILRPEREERRVELVERSGIVGKRVELVKGEDTTHHLYMGSIKNTVH